MPKLSSTRKKVYLSLIWISFSLLIIGGILLVDVYKEEVIPYVVYYIIAVGLSLTIFILTTIMLRQNKSIRFILRIFVVFWMIILYSASIFGMSIGILQISSRYFATDPYLTWTDDQDPVTGITISFITSFPEKKTINYGESPNNLLNSIEDSVATRYHKFAINGLIENTTYYYKVPGFPLKQFTTAPLGKFNYTFTVWSDHRTNTNIMSSYTQPNIVPLMFNRLKSLGITSAFSIFTGDLTSNANDTLSWDTWFNDISYKDWAINSSLQIAYGNHERYGDNETKIIQMYYPYTPKPDGHFYYSFDYGVAHFIILDPYASGHSWSDTFTPEQLSWLENDLETHQEANFTMIFMHPPPSDLTGICSDLATLSLTYDIDVIFCGHDHIFRHQILPGTTDTQEITMGLGGNPNNEFRDFDCDTAFARVTVSPEELHIIVEFTNGTALSDFTIYA